MIMMIMMMMFIIMNDYGNDEYLICPGLKSFMSIEQDGQDVVDGHGHIS